MHTLWRRELQSGLVVEVVVTDRGDGDFAPGSPGVETRRRAVTARPWNWLDQVHGATVVEVDRPGDGVGRRADAMVTGEPEPVLCIQTADCAPLALVSESGRRAMAHVGWRGLVAGIVEATVDAVGEPTGDLTAVVGPCIAGSVYEFGEHDLDRVAAAYGEAVRAVTADGRSALDLRAGLGVALGRSGVSTIVMDPRCSSSPELFSHRVRGESERMSMVCFVDSADE